MASITSNPVPLITAKDIIKPSEDFLLSKADYKRLRQAISDFDDNLALYKFNIHEDNNQEQQFLKAGEDLKEAVIELFRDSQFLTSLKDEAFRANFIEAMERVGKLAKDPTSINKDDAEAVRNVSEAALEKKLPIWSRLRSSLEGSSIESLPGVGGIKSPLGVSMLSSPFGVFCAIAAAIALAAFVTFLALTGVGAPLAVAAIVAVAYVYTAGMALGAVGAGAGMALGAAGAGMALGTAGAGIAAAAPVIGLGVNAVATGAAVAAKEPILTGVIAAGAAGVAVVGAKDVITSKEVISTKIKHASNMEKSGQNPKDPIEVYKVKLKHIHESMSSEQPSESSEKDEDSPQSGP